MKQKWRTRNVYEYTRRLQQQQHEETAYAVKMFFLKINCDPDLHND